MSTYADDTQSQSQSQSDSQPQAPTAPVGRPPLRRAYDGRILAGVCAGIADYLAVDVTLVRVAFAALTLIGGAGVPLYVACLLLIPEEGTDQSVAGSLLDSLQHGTR
jgi:phage shock protein PspC (stress-responsive transcriptional regulator)